MPLPTTVIRSTGAGGIRSERGGMTALSRAAAGCRGCTAGSMDSNLNWLCKSRPLFVLKSVYHCLFLSKMRLFFAKDNVGRAAGGAQTVPKPLPRPAWSLGTLGVRPGAIPPDTIASGFYTQYQMGGKGGHLILTINYSRYQMGAKRRPSDIDYKL